MLRVQKVQGGILQCKLQAKAWQKWVESITTCVAHIKRMKVASYLDKNKSCGWQLAFFENKAWGHLELISHSFFTVNLSKCGYVAEIGGKLIKWYTQLWEKVKSEKKKNPLE